MPAKRKPVKLRPVTRAAYQESVSVIAEALLLLDSLEAAQAIRLPFAGYSDTRRKMIDLINRVAK